MKNNKTFVVSLGGSVMCPDTLDQKFIRRFYHFILKAVKDGFRFVIITGGGKLCRDYQKAATDIGNVSNEKLDWLGIEVTKLNALFLQTIFKQLANPLLLDKQGKVKSFDRYPLIIGCGWQPGTSTDFDAVKTAIDLGIKTVINLGKPAYVYTANPDKDPKAKPIIETTWQDYFKIIPKKWTPGLNAPFDPIASRLAQKYNTTVIVTDGRNLANFQKIITGKKFKGTTIQNKQDLPV